MAAMRRLTYRDLELLPEEQEGDQHELIDGELFATPVPTLRHQIVSGKLFRYLDRHVEHRSLGMVFPAPTGVRLAPNTLAIPELCFVAAERAPDPDAQTIDVPPDIVIEILSPGTRRRDLELKRALYARFKVPEYWIVDPDGRAVAVLTLAGDSYEQVPGEGDGAITSRVLPALELTLAQVLADA